MPKGLKPRFVAWALIALSVALLLARYPGAPQTYRERLPSDFGVYVNAVERFEAGKSPYIAGEYSAFKYSPGILAAMRLLPRDGGMAWVIFSVLCIVGMGVALAFSAPFASWRSVGLLALGLALSWKGILETLDYGQLELLIFALAMGSGVLLNRVPGLSGFFAGILPWIKLPWVLLAFPMLIASGKKGLRQFLSGYLLAWFVWGAAVPSLAFGPEGAKALFQGWLAVLETQPAALYFSAINQSLFVSALRWTGGDVGIGIGLVAAVAGWLMGRMVLKLTTRGSSESPASWMTPWLIFVQLVSPLSWRWASALLLGAPLAAESPGARRSWLPPLARYAVWAAVGVLWLLQLNPVVKAFGLHHWTDLHIHGLISWYWLALLLLTL